MAPVRANKRLAQHNRHVKFKAQPTAEDDGVPQVFKDMLAEDAADSRDVEYRASKRRRVGERALVCHKDVEHTDEIGLTDDEPVTARTQMVEDLDHDSDDEEFEWEEVDTLGVSSINIGSADATSGGEDLIIVIDDSKIPSEPRQRRVRKPVTASEKRIRLDVHKAHLLCLLFHTYQRNHWCNDLALQKSVRRSLRISAKLVQKIHPEVAASQFQKSNWLKEALKELSVSWRAMFSITKHGLRRSTWNISGAATDHEHTESFVDLREFRDKSVSLAGSADFGAQLFCALLRGLGLETRLVCSLQPLPFATTAATISPAKAPVVPTVYAIESEDDNHRSDSTDTSPRMKNRKISRLGGTPRNRRTISHSTTPATSASPQVKGISRPRHPIFWVEVFDTSYQTWMSVDPLATGNIGKPQSLEPGLNDPDNLLSYVLAFEEDNTAHDVTRRYTKAYNAKTRRLRVECTDNGIKWYKQALRPFRRRRKLDRDAVEEAYFTQRDIQEGMPKNIDDFRGHPVYVLERHLYRDEALHPRHEVGKVGQRPKHAGSSVNLESVYRRQDVHVVKSADKWFRQGRKLKEGVKPLKHVKARKRQEVFDDVDEDEQRQGPDAAQVSLGLYAHFQTELYVPPPVTTDGLLPRNEFGNLDVYVRSMIPAGAVHVKSPHARQAARLLGIDYVDAITGFTFRGRHGTAVVNGIVVAAEASDAMQATLEGIAYTRNVEMANARRERVLVLWRKFVLGLRIVESVKQYKKADESSDDDDDDDDSEEFVDSDVERELNDSTNSRGNGVGYEMLATSMLPEIEPFEIVESIHKLLEQKKPIQQAPTVTLHSAEEHEDGGFDRDDDPAIYHDKFSVNAHRNLAGGGFIQDDAITAFHDHNSLQPDEEVEAGGFVVGDDESILQDDVGRAETVVDGHSATTRLLATQEPTGAISASYMDEAMADEMDMEQDEIPDTADRESLLSHDPADDEVDPDWVD